MGPLPQMMEHTGLTCLSCCQHRIKSWACGELRRLRGSTQSPGITHASTDGTSAVSAFLVKKYRCTESKCRIGKYAVTGNRNTHFAIRRTRHTLNGESSPGPHAEKYAYCRAWVQTGGPFIHHHRPKGQEEAWFRQDRQRRYEIYGVC